MNKTTIKSFNDYFIANKLNEADNDTQLLIDNIKDTHQVYITNKSKVDTLVTKYKNIDTNLSDMDIEFTKLTDTIENDDLLRKYYVSKKLELKKVRLEDEVKQIMEELRINQTELAEMMKKLQ